MYYTLHTKLRLGIIELEYFLLSVRCSGNSVQLSAW